MSNIKLYNTPIELGMRSLILLRQGELQQVLPDLDKLVYLDHLCLNTGDLGGPDSLSAPVPNRGVQVYAKRELIKKGIKTLLSKDLISLINTDQGFTYKINQAGNLLLELFTTNYYRELSIRAEWVFQRWGALPPSEIKKFIDTNMQQWGGEFEGDNNGNKA